MGVEGVYICVRVFECVREREAERGSPGQKWREESVGIDRRGKWSGLNHECKRGEKTALVAIVFRLSLFHAEEIKYTFGLELI